MATPELDSTYWDQRYRQAQTGWDVGEVSRPLKEYIDQLSRKNLRILIPGCGNAYEAMYLLQQGFTDITVIDIAPTLTENLKRQLADFIPVPLKVLTGDFFTLEGTYDLILEQTFFCALPPVMRPDYVVKMKELLSPAGQLAGVLFNRDFEGGPPFGGSIAEYEALFSPHFNDLRLAPCYNSIEPRKNTEAFLIAGNK